MIEILKVKSENVSGPQSKKSKVEDIEDYILLTKNIIENIEIRNFIRQVDSGSSTLIRGFLKRTFTRTFTAKLPSTNGQ